jgi:hypothetical protein
MCFIISHSRSFLSVADNFELYLLDILLQDFCVRGGDWIENLL